jgi:uncharacterized membrane protein
MGTAKQAAFQCPLCGIAKPIDDGKPLELISHPVDDLIRDQHPEVKAQDLICMACRTKSRGEYVQKSLETERGEITALEEEVVRSLKESETLAKNINHEFDQTITFGEKIADKVAEFGGSWTFIIIFGAILGVWIIVNSLALLMKPFDPFPYIFLNLILSCLAAIQAPIIMMSQNRHQAKDRLSSEHDYQVNLKAEIEIRHINAKLDQLLTHQWQRLLEIQRIQMDTMEDLARRLPDKV